MAMQSCKSDAGTVVPFQDQVTEDSLDIMETAQYCTYAIQVPMYKALALHCRFVYSVLCLWQWNANTGNVLFHDSLDYSNTGNSC